MSTLNVTNIKAADGTSGLSIANSTGVVTATKEIVETDYMIDQWRLTQNSTGNGTIDAYWARFDFAQVGNGGVNNGGTIGTQMQEASGIFTFPRTGVYLVTFDGNFLLRPTDAPLSEHVYISVTTNNSTYVHYVITQTGMTSTSVNSNVITDLSTSCRTLVNVTDTSNVKVKFTKDGFETSSTELYGSTGFARTNVIFERKGPAQ